MRWRRRRREMKPSPSPSPALRLYQQYEMEDPAASIACGSVGMEVDDADHLVDLLVDLDRPPPPPPRSMQTSSTPSRTTSTTPISTDHPLSQLLQISGLPQ
ncbi:putative ABC transporter G family member 43 [Iris pallida]|uniref:ABC transporter G family member 43 n=1 Tax=Iris pallida TaxID=29817 RepID=A0AAX6F7M7_IRIPA|nr:putative ABC transporter G family member 43 [Iris pallida]